MSISENYWFSIETYDLLWKLNLEVDILQISSQHSWNSIIIYKIIALNPHTCWTESSLHLDVQDSSRRGIFCYTHWETIQRKQLHVQSCVVLGRRILRLQIVWRSDWEMFWNRTGKCSALTLAGLAGEYAIQTDEVERQEGNDTVHERRSQWRLHGSKELWKAWTLTLGTIGHTWTSTHHSCMFLSTDHHHSSFSPTCLFLYFLAFPELRIAEKQFWENNCMSQTALSWVAAFRDCTVFF